MTNYSTKKVSYNEDVTVKEISTHREWTSNERFSVWYTEDDYRQFALAEKNERLSDPISLKLDQVERSRRIEFVRYLVLRAQHIQRKIAKNNDWSKKEDSSKWLAEFYQHHSEECAIEARHRGLENKLLILDIKLREVLKHSALFKNLAVSTKSSNNKNGCSSNKERWLAVERGNAANSSYINSSPNTLCEDLNLKEKLNPIFSPTPGFVALKVTISPLDRSSKITTQNRLKHDKQERWFTPPLLRP